MVKYCWLDCVEWSGVFLVVIDVFRLLLGDVVVVGEFEVDFLVVVFGI